MAEWGDFGDPPPIDATLTPASPVGVVAMVTRGEDDVTFRLAMSAGIELASVPMRDSTLSLYVPLGVDVTTSDVSGKGTGVSSADSATLAPDSPLGEPLPILDFALSAAGEEESCKTNFGTFNPLGKGVWSLVTTGVRASSERGTCWEWGASSTVTLWGSAFRVSSRLLSAGLMGAALAILAEEEGVTWLC